MTADSPPARLSPAECTCFRVRSAARRVTQIYSRHLAPTGLRISQFSLLGYVVARGPVSITELSELLATDRTTLTRNLRPLERRGLMVFAPDPADRRSRALHLTDKGRQTFRDAHPGWQAAQALVERRLGTTETRALNAALDHLLDRLAP